jgi:hypothetical protein
VHAERNAVAQLVFTHAPGGRERQDQPVADLLAELEHRLRLFRIGDHFGVGAGLHVAPEIQRDARAAGRRQVDRLERQVGGAAQLEAAAGKEQRCSEG